MKAPLRFVVLTMLLIRKSNKCFDAVFMFVIFQMNSCHLLYVENHEICYGKKELCHVISIIVSVRDSDKGICKIAMQLCSCHRLMYQHFMQYLHLWMTAYHLMHFFNCSLCRGWISEDSVLSSFIWIASFNNSLAPAHY